MNPRARRSLLISTPLLLVVLAIAFAGCGKDKGTGPSLGSATVSGVVENTTADAALAGASVKASSGATATTDAEGRFSISIPADQRVRIDVTKANFSLNQLVVQLGNGETKSFAVGLMAAGTSESVTPSAGGSVTDAASGAVLALPADFVTASGPVTVTVTGLDPTTDDIKALPGGLDALDATGQAVYLTPVSFAEYTVKDASGNVLPYNPSASAGADIELPIPASLAGQPGYEEGDPIECYLYDPADGKWKTPVPGTIGISSVNGELAIKATIFHLSWYGGAPASTDVGCVEGIVRLNGTPLAGVDIEAFPGGSTRTDAQGHYRVDAALNSEVRVVASQALGTSFRMAEGTVHVGSTPTPCAELDLSLGNVQQGAYEIESFVESIEVSGVAFDMAWADVTVAAGLEHIPVTGATVQVGTGGAWFTLAHSTNGVYQIMTGTGGFSLMPGHDYTLRLDFDSDGSYDATGQVKMVGRAVITSPAASSTVGGSFTASWNDAGTSVGGYSAYYYGVISPAKGDTTNGNFFVTTSRTKVIGNGVPDPVYQFPNDPLDAGDYQFQIFSANGPYWYFLGDTSYTPNVTGTNASGYFSSIGLGPTVNFTSSGITTATAPRVARAAEPERGRSPGRLETLLRRAESTARSRALSHGRSRSQVTASRR